MDLRAEVIKLNRSIFPDGCEICGEEADFEMGEFIMPEGDRKIAHAQCGLDFGGTVA